VVPEGHPWTKKEYVTAEDFENQTLFIYDYPVETTSIYRSLIEPNGVKLKDVVAIQLTEATIEMVKAGLGIKVMATWALKPYLSSNRLATVRVTKNGLHRTWYVAMLKKEETPSYLNYFVEHLCLNCVLD
jgi:LysR family transcriptional regulator for metE and metH